MTSHRSEVAKSAAIGAPFLPSIRQNNKKNQQNSNTNDRSKRKTLFPEADLFTVFYQVLLGFTRFYWV